MWVNGDFTIAGWLYVEEYRSFQRFFEFGNGPYSDNVQYSPSPSGTTLYDTYSIRRHACTGGTPTHSFCNAPSYPFKKWVFITIVQRGSVGEVWQDAINKTTAVVTMVTPCSTVRTQCYFGKSPFTEDKLFKGKMDDIRIYDRALSASEIDSLYQDKGQCKTSKTPNRIMEIINSYQFSLQQNFPNPTNGETVIAYSLPESSNQGTISVFDITGKRIKTLDLNSNKGSIVIPKGEFIPGLYFYSLMTDGKTLDTKKMMITGN